VEAARDKKAEDIVILDLRGLSDVTDHFFICQGTSDRQVLAISDAVEERLFRELSRKPSHVEGRRSSDWVLMDYIDFVVHIFVAEKRAFYRLERLWGDAPREEVPDPAPPPASPGSGDPGRISS
jgi:ribosome-associated protein